MLYEVITINRVAAIIDLPHPEWAGEGQTVGGGALLAGRSHDDHVADLLQRFAGDVGRYPDDFTQFAVHLDRDLDSVLQQSGGIVFWPRLIVITSYSIHYTKLYEAITASAAD